MAHRERRRSERRRRKARSLEQAAAGGGNGDPAAEGEGFREAYRARSEERNREAREELEPLRAGERPLVVTIGAALSTLLALSIAIAYAAGVEVDGERPAVAQVVAPVLLLGVMAWGMLRARYWAVLGFQVVLVILLVSATLGLVQAANATQAIGNTVLVAVAGTFFWFMVRALARIQMPRIGSR